MAKKNLKNIPQGNKISEQETNATKYIKFYEFLLFDPTYRELSEKAKLLYSYLRSKIPYFEFQTKANEQGIEGTKSYRDEEGFIYCIADNAELEYLLKASEPTVIRAKKDLEAFGLLLQDPVKNKTNRLYVLQPAEVANAWTHIDEIKKYRAEKEKANLEKRKQQKEKQHKAAEQPASSSNTGDLKKLSHGDLKNFSHGDLKNLSKIQSKHLKSNLSSKIQLNLSIYKEEIHNSKLPDSIKLALNDKKIDRLIYHNISVSDLFTNYELHKESVNPGQYISALDFALTLKDKIKDFSKVMAQNINNQINFANSNQNIAVNTGRKEMVPDWLQARQEAAAAKEESGAEQQALTIEQLEKVAQWYKDGYKDVNPQLMEQILQLGLLEESDL
ncbi:hypothetical protein P4639_25685 [Priestia megaterium]|uniref:hypothetical protein n=1 Tax=Priestia megaterium TaxID=1404 RepID=UPI002E1BDBA7|nr:hypothetical protein [Priestia megaterium]